jgi:hypothetical protein
LVSVDVQKGVGIKAAASLLAAIAELMQQISLLCSRVGTESSVFGDGGSVWCGNTTRCCAGFGALTDPKSDVLFDVAKGLSHQSTAIKVAAIITKYAQQRLRMSLTRNIFTRKAKRCISLLRKEAGVRERMGRVGGCKQRSGGD